MVTRYVKACPCFYSLVMCGNTFSKTEIEVNEGMTTFQTLQTWIGVNFMRYQLEWVTLHSLSIFSHD